MKKLLLYLTTVLLFFGCATDFLSEDEPNAASANFDLLWQDFDAHCSLFQSKNIDWNAAYDLYKAQINENTTQDELWEIVTQMLEVFDDSHITLYSDAERDVFISGFALNEKSKSEFSTSLITDSYLESRIEITSEDNFSYGKIKNKNIGYIYLGAEGGTNPDSIEEILEALKTYDALIFDIRQNTGGDDRYGRRIASAFSDNTDLIYTVRTRNGPNHDDFDGLTEYYFESTGKPPYQKPVVLLTDRRTISAGEIFGLYMKNAGSVIQIGDTTAGDFSTVSNRRFLPNGWSYNYPIQIPQLPDGTYLDGNGLVPDIYSKNTSSSIENREDLVLEDAIEFLSDMQGI